MYPATRSRGGWCVWTVIRGHLAGAGLGGCGLLVAGCAAAAGAAGAVAVILVTGFFLGQIQASFDATAHSYGYSDVGSALLSFNQPHNSNVELTGFTGRLPGFYILILSNSGDKAIRQSKDEATPAFATDVDINFQTLPPTITGTIKEIGGEQEFPLTDAFPEIDPPTVRVTRVDENGGYDVRFGITARGTQGEKLEYALVWHARLNSSGFALDGDIEIDRVLTTADGEEIRIQGDGSLATTKQPEGSVPPDGANDNSTGDPGNDGTGSADEDANQDNDNTADDGEQTPPDDAPAPSSCIPDLPPLVAQAVDQFLAPLGRDALDADADGIVTPEEVEVGLAPVLAIFNVELLPDAAECIAELLNA